MGGFFSCRTVLFGVGSGPLVWGRVAAWVMRSTPAWMTQDRAHTNCFVDDPIIPLKGTTSQRRKLAMGVLLWWSTLRLKLAFEKGSFGSSVVWIGTQFEVNSKVNKVEIRLPVNSGTPHEQSRRDGEASRGAKNCGQGQLGGQFLAPVETVRKAIVGEFVQEFVWRQSGVGVQAASVASTHFIEDVPRATTPSW